MCGIVGQLAFSDQDVDLHREKIFSSLVALMARRGPDDEGVWSDGKRVTLGFRRLAVLDLSDAGHQPMLTQDGRYAMVFNGEASITSANCAANSSTKVSDSAPREMPKSSCMLWPDGARESCLALTACLRWGFTTR